MNVPDPRTGNQPGPGAPIALVIVAAVIIGGLLGQPSIGMLTGVGLGLLIWLGFWQMGKRK